MTIFVQSKFLDFFFYKAVHYFYSSCPKLMYVFVNAIKEDCVCGVYIWIKKFIQEIRLNYMNYILNVWQNILSHANKCQFLK